LLEPIEEVVIDVDEEHAGVVVQKMSERKAEMVELRRRAAIASGWYSTRRRAA
jgi:predicted membrane GTPase involved in stress response